MCTDIGRFVGTDLACVSPAEPVRSALHRSPFRLIDSVRVGHTTNGGRTMESMRDEPQPRHAARRIHYLRVGMLPERQLDCHAVCIAIGKRH